jgi:hypothetical protein
MKIIIETIPHDHHRYDTVGDWQWLGDELHIKVSEMEDWRHEALVGIHEAVEALICKQDGVTEASVDKFDMDPLMSKDCARLDIEPGDHPNAPYKTQHCVATGVERMLCAALGVDWYEYEGELDDLSVKPDRGGNA